MPTLVAPLEDPKLYPDAPAAILTAVYNEIYAVSLGTINDFRAHSPAAALAEGLLFAILELLYYANKLVLSVSISYLKMAGIQQVLGSAAVVDLTFTIQPIGNTFTLSAGYICKDDAGREFTTDAVLSIPPGQIEGTVSATSSAVIGSTRQTAVGSQYNVPAGAIKNLTDSRAFLLGVTNREKAQGGTDGETLDQTRARGFAKLRDRQVLITADHYEQKATEYLGPGSIAHAVGRLEANKQGYQDGAVHVFCLNADGSTLNSAQLTDLRTLLSTYSAAGLQDLVSVSSLDILNAQIYVVAELIPGSNPSTVASRIYARLGEYLAPGRLPYGQPVLLEEIKYVVRGSGIKTVQSVSFLLADGADVTVYNSDLPIPNEWTVPILHNLEISLIDTTNNQSYPFSFGDGGDVD